MELLPVGFLLWLHALHPHPFHPYQPHDGPPSGNLVNLERADKDLPVDNMLELEGSQYTVDGLNQTLSNNLPAVFNAMNPSTDDPTIRNVTLSVNGNDVQFGYQKQIAFLWEQVNIDASTEVDGASCPEAGQTGFEIIFTMLGSTSSEAQGYVNGARILMCANPTQSSSNTGNTGNTGGAGLEISIERDLYAGPQYQDWIGSLMGDFLRNFGPALQTILEST